MPVSSALRRLLHVREMEEEQLRLALEAAMGDLHALQRALDAARAREHGGRMLLVGSASTNEVIDRFAALTEVDAAGRAAAALKPKIAAAETTEVDARQEYFDKRLERRQAETLIEESAAREAVEAERRNQQSLDEAFGARQYRRRRDEEKPPAAARGPHPVQIANLEPESTSESSPLPKLGSTSES